MARLSYGAPGVYVEEAPSARQPIAGVGTNTVAFIGRGARHDPSPGALRGLRPGRRPCGDGAQAQARERCGEGSASRRAEDPQRAGQGPGRQAARAAEGAREGEPPRGGKDHRGQASHGRKGGAAGSGRAGGRRGGRQQASRGGGRPRRGSAHPRCRPGEDRSEPGRFEGAAGPGRGRAGRRAGSAGRPGSRGPGLRERRAATASAQAFDHAAVLPGAVRSGGRAAGDEAVHQFHRVRQSLRGLLRLRRCPAEPFGCGGALALQAAVPRTPLPDACRQGLLRQRRHARIRRPGHQCGGSPEGARAHRVDRRGVHHRRAGPAQDRRRVGRAGDSLRKRRSPECVRHPRLPDRGERRRVERLRYLEAQFRQRRQHAAAHEQLRGVLLPLHRGQRSGQAAAGRRPVAPGGAQVPRPHPRRAQRTHGRRVRPHRRGARRAQGTGQRGRARRAGGQVLRQQAQAGPAQPAGRQLPAHHERGSDGLGRPQHRRRAQPRVEVRQRAPLRGLPRRVDRRGNAMGGVRAQRPLAVVEDPAQRLGLPDERLAQRRARWGRRRRKRST